VEYTGEMKNKYKILIGITEGKKSFGRCRHLWEGNMKIDIKIYGKNYGPNSVVSSDGLL